MNFPDKTLHNKIALELLNIELSEYPSDASAVGVLDATSEAVGRFDFFNSGSDFLQLAKELGKNCIVILSCVNDDWELIGWKAHDYKNNQESEMYETYEDAASAGLTFWADSNPTPMGKKIAALTQDIKNDKALVLALLKKHDLYAPNYMKLHGDACSRKKKKDLPIEHQHDTMNL